MMVRDSKPGRSPDRTEPSSPGDLACLKDMDSLGELPGMPGAAAELAPESPDSPGRFSSNSPGPEVREPRSADRM